MRRKEDQISKSIRFALWESRPHVCGICKKSIDNFSEMHVDHIIPVSKGGETTPENLQLTHSFCNISKGNKIYNLNGQRDTTDILTAQDDVSCEQNYEIEIPKNKWHYKKTDIPDHGDKIIILHRGSIKLVFFDFDTKKIFYDGYREYPIDHVDCWMYAEDLYRDAMIHFNNVFFESFERWKRKEEGNVCLN